MIQRGFRDQLVRKARWAHRGHRAAISTLILIPILMAPWIGSKSWWAVTPSMGQMCQWTSTEMAYLTFYKAAMAMMEWMVSTVLMARMGPALQT